MRRYRAIEWAYPVERAEGLKQANVVDPDRTTVALDLPLARRYDRRHRVALVSADRGAGMTTTREAVVGAKHWLTKRQAAGAPAALATRPGLGSEP